METYLNRFVTSTCNEVFFVCCIFHLEIASQKYTSSTLYTYATRAYERLEAVRRSVQLPYIVSPILCRMQCLLNATYKVSFMFAPTSLRSQQLAIITAGGLLGILILVTVVTSKLMQLIIHIRRILKCDLTQDGYTSSPLLLAVAVHKLLMRQITPSFIPVVCHRSHHQICLFQSFIPVV